MEFSLRDHSLLLKLICGTIFFLLTCMNVVILACCVLWSVQKPQCVLCVVAGRPRFPWTFVAAVFICRYVAPAGSCARCLAWVLDVDVQLLD